jgi:hypothetical protein
MTEAQQGQANSCRSGNGSPTREFDLLLIAFFYPFVSVLGLRMLGGPFGLLDLHNFYLFVFVFPALTVVIVLVRRVAGTRYHPASLVVFMAWMKVIAYAHYRLFMMAWDSI